MYKRQHTHTHIHTHTHTHTSEFSLCARRLTYFSVPAYYLSGPNLSVWQQTKSDYIACTAFSFQRNGVGITGPCPSERGDCAADGGSSASEEDVAGQIGEFADKPVAFYSDTWKVGKLVTVWTDIGKVGKLVTVWTCLLYTSPSPRDSGISRMPSSA